MGYDLVKKELLEIKAKFGDPRKSEISLLFCTFMPIYLKVLRFCFTDFFIEENGIFFTFIFLRIPTTKLHRVNCCEGKNYFLENVGDFLENHNFFIEKVVNQNNFKRFFMRFNVFSSKTIKIFNLNIFNFFFKINTL